MMDLETAYSIIENCSGFADESSSVGEAWAFVVNEVKRLREENEWLKEDIKRFESFRQPQSTVHKDW